MFDSKKLLDAIMGGGIGAPQSGLGDVVGQAPSDESAKREPIADRSFGSIVRHVLQEASSGLKDVAREVEARTGVGTKADEMLKQATGQGAGDLWSQARELANRNRLGCRRRDRRSRRPPSGYRTRAHPGYQDGQVGWSRRDRRACL